MSPNIIDYFDAPPWEFLSNFYPASVTLPSRWTGQLDVFPTSEHAFQAFKARYPSDYDAVRLAETPREAKQLGRRVPLRGDWELVKDTIMLTILRQKFSIEPLRSLLLSTGSAVLIEGNTWGDKYWGVCDGEGLNMLGQLLTIVRGELRG